MISRCHPNNIQMSWCRSDYHGAPNMVTSGKIIVLTPVLQTGLKKHKYILFLANENVWTAEIHL